jgi:hypothetical protein
MSMFVQTLRSRWLAGVIHAGLWLMLYLTVIHMSGSRTDIFEYLGPSAPPQSPAPVARLASLFAPGTFQHKFAGTNALDPFYTRNFVPPPAPAPPPPPTTKKIPIIYQGFYFTEAGPQKVIFKMSDLFVTIPIGAQVATNIFLSNADALSMTLTNVNGQTNILKLNKAGEIEVPIK